MGILGLIVLLIGLVYFIFFRKPNLGGELDVVNSNIKNGLIQEYGSWDKVPNWRKRYFHLDPDGNYNNNEIELSEIYKRLDKEEREINFKEYGVKETNNERLKRESEEKRKRLKRESEEKRKQLKRESEEKTKQLNREKEEKRKEILSKKYDSEIVNKIVKKELAIGMSKNMVLDMKGKPNHKTQSVSQNATREEWFYGAYKNRLNKVSFKFRVVLVNEKVTGWNDINN